MNIEQILLKPELYIGNSSNIPILSDQILNLNWRHIDLYQVEGPKNNIYFHTQKCSQL